MRTLALRVYNKDMNRFMAFIPSEFTKTQWIVGLVILFSCLGTALLGVKLFTAPAVIVPASGVALAALVLAGLKYWPFVYAGFLLAVLVPGSSPLFIILLPIAQTAQAFVGAYILKLAEFDPLLRRLQDIFIFLGVALTVSLIVPSVGFFTFYLHYLLGNPYFTPVTWGSWWTGQILSLLIIAPLIIRWLAEPHFYRLPQYRTTGKIIEITAVLLSLFVITWVVAWSGIEQIGGISMIYVLLVPLFWLAIRVGPRFTILGICIVAVTLLSGTLYGPFAPTPEQLGVRLFQIEMFICIIAVIFYIIAGLQEERTEMTKSLRHHIDKVEDALNKLSLQDRAKSDFIAVLAHELRNPLAPVVSALELIRINHPKSGEEAAALDLMDDRLKTIERLLDDLLDVSRISRAKLKIRKEPVELRRMIDHSIQAIDRHIKNRNQTLVIDLPSEPIVLDADPVRIEQVITNLLNNASKFTPPGGRIEIAAKREGKYVAIRVTDTGIGIDSAMIERIFEPFLQLETGESKGEGLGIGLSLTQRLVEMHGGTIEARSAGLEQGSEFLVRLPMLPGYPTTPVEEKVDPAPPAREYAEQKRPRSVLVVDDNIAAAHGIGKLLEYKGYEVMYAYTGSEAKEKIVSLAPEAVILDIGLPDMDGYSLANMVRVGMGFEGLLIALTGYGQEEDKERARAAGFNHHLTKPIGIEELHAVLTMPGRS